MGHKSNSNSSDNDVGDNIYFGDQKKEASEEFDYLHQSPEALPLRIPAQRHISLLR